MVGIAVVLVSKKHPEHRDHVGDVEKRGSCSAHLPKGCLEGTSNVTLREVQSHQPSTRPYPCMGKRLKKASVWAKYSLKIHPNTKPKFSKRHNTIQIPIQLPSLVAPIWRFGPGRVLRRSQRPTWRFWTLPGVVVGIFDLWIYGGGAVFFLVLLFPTCQVRVVRFYACARRVAARH